MTDALAGIHPSGGPGPSAAADPLRGGHPLEGSSEVAREERRAILRLWSALAGGALVLAGGILGLSGAVPEGHAALPATIGAVALGAPLILRAARSLWTGALRMDELVALAVLACFALGEPVTAGVVSFLMLAAAAIEKRTALGARAAIESLVRLAPKRARRIVEGGAEEEIDASEVRPGDLLRVLAGDSVPADGEVVRGRSSIDQATITGESIPADKSPGDPVFAGTMNLTGALEIRVARAGPDTTLGRVQALMRDAGRTRTPFMRLVDGYVVWYMPVVLTIACLILFFTRSWERAIAALVVSCPSALVLAMPTAVVAALSAAMRIGILAKSAGDLERAADASAVVFDKTGTLTTGALSVTRMRPAEGVDPTELLRLAAAVEKDSRHPAARAVVAVAREARIPLGDAEDVREEPGRGVRGMVAGTEVLVGRAALLEEAGIDVSALPPTDAPGASILCVAAAGRALGWLALEDRARPEARAAVEELRRLGIRRLVLLTGDRWDVARRIGEELGATEVEAECLPERKREIVAAARADGPVMVVGDGVNDAPALAAGDIGVAMGAAGSDVALSSASIALMNDDLTRLPFLIRLSRRLRAVVHQNLLLGAVFIIAGLALASVGALSAIAAALLQNLGAFIILFSSARIVRFGESIASHDPRRARGAS
ncbi:MAG: cation-translocating P-type ATPase [Planctomycetes bacterium]|nr:cation-translocating P-type ATPase [Planctomycetota bacterium]